MLIDTKNIEERHKVVIVEKKINSSSVDPSLDPQL